jgi:hypothetical protein
MRKLIYQALINSLPLTAVIPANRWIQAGSMDNQILKPFGIIRLTDTAPSISRSPQPGLQIWVHDNRGSYGQIDNTIELVKTALLDALPMENSTHRIVHIGWIGDSPDLVDEGFNTNTKFSSFTLTGRK